MVAYTDTTHTGKTAFLNYVLVRRLQAKMPTIYCNKPNVAFMLNNDGVTKIQLGVHPLPSDMDEPSTCALINISDALPQVPIHFHPIDRDMRVVVATSPHPMHLENFSKEHKVHTYCMPLCSWSDLYGIRWGWINVIY